MSANRHRTAQLVAMIGIAAIGVGCAPNAGNDARDDSTTNEASAGRPRYVSTIMVGGQHWTLDNVSYLSI